MFSHLIRTTQQLTMITGLCPRRFESYHRYIYISFSANSHGNPIFVVTIENIQQQFKKCLVSLTSTHYTRRSTNLCNIREVCCSSAENAFRFLHKSIFNWQQFKNLFLYYSFSRQTSNYNDRRFEDY